MRGLPFEVRFWSRVEVGPKYKCWKWRGSHDDNGYGHCLGPDGHRIGAHVQAYVFLIGPVPEGKELHHRCRNEWCSNPYHCEPVTKLEHGKERQHKHCQHGHLITVKDGIRRCWTCKRMWDNARAQGRLPVFKSRREASA